VRLLTLSVELKKKLFFNPQCCRPTRPPAKRQAPEAAAVVDEDIVRFDTVGAVCRDMAGSVATGIFVFAFLS
jgi:hypothetical protein